MLIQHLRLWVNLYDPINDRQEQFGLVQKRHFLK